MDISNRKLYDLLSAIEYIPAADLQKAVEVASRDRTSLYDYLIAHDLITDKDIGRLIADSIGLPFIALGDLNIPERILKITPQPIAKRYKVITYGLGEKGLQIAAADSRQSELFSMLAKKAGVTSYRVFYATDKDLSSALQLYKKRLQDFSATLSTSPAEKADVPVAKIVDTLIEYSYDAKASDIHIEPSRTATRIRFRIDGVLHDVMDLPRHYHNQIVARIKVLSRLRTDEHLSAQDGRMHANLKQESLDIRVSIVPIVTGEKVVMRLLTSHSRHFSLTDLGMSAADLAKAKKGYSRPYGMVLTTGPTGSGKTTSIYAILKIINSREKNIATIEDPVEYEIDGINQIQTNAKTNLTFANGLRSILRQDPNIIYVGEIRDEETASIAINSATTGHLVFSTLHTNDAATTLPRLIDMQAEPFLVASTINTIIAQRLIRKICERCKVSIEMTRTKGEWQGDLKTAGQLHSLNQETVNKHFGKSGIIRLYHGKGCTVCHDTGYSGRVGIFEVLEVTPAIQKLIVQKASSDDIFEQAKKEGMSSMLDDGLTKVRAGVTSMEEVVRATSE
jgi:type II secretory ATPase GspE/PulE/Tfp pilus assembly ATPase PilB-like protein